MDLEEFNRTKEKLIDAESKIYAAFGIAYCMQCSKCDQKISFFQVLQFFERNNIKNKIACPLCQSPSVGITATLCDPGDKEEILEYYLQSIPRQIGELYKSKTDCGINPYENDFLYSQAIVNSSISLEFIVSKIAAEKLNNEQLLDDSIVKYIVERMKPTISDYIELLEICGFENVKKNFDKLRGIWNIRNNIVHRGYKADFIDFAKSYIGTGEILIYLQNEQK